MADKVFVQIDDKVKELKGAELEAFLEQQEKEQEPFRLFEAEQQAKEAARQSAIDKLKKLGLNEEEIAALVP